LPGDTTEEEIKGSTEGAIISRERTLAQRSQHEMEHKGGLRAWHRGEQEETTDSMTKGAL